jgi:hypothetical protein
MSDLSKLLHGARDDASFLDKLDLAPEEVTALESARRDVRTAVRDAFNREARKRFEVAVAPRFYTQGSFAYRTINRPAYPPRQQKDLDDGVYLPLTFVKGESRPSQAAEVYFRFIDEILQALCKARGWAFATRPTCARVTIAPDAHVDVPLYAIPDREFLLLSKAVTAAFAEDAAYDFMNARLAKIDNWEALPSDQVLLAHREEDWKVSDPRAIHEWFLAAVDRYGEQLRRLSRYVKAWRDEKGTQIGSLSSICLMACVFEVYEASRGLDRRDDRALLEVARALPKLLEGPVLNPTDRSEELCAKLSRVERQAAIGLASALAGDVDAAIRASEASQSIAFLRRSLGVRVPNRSDLVAAEIVAATIRREPARVVAAPVVGRSISA